MLAMVVNDDAGHLSLLVALRFIASMLAPTGVAAIVVNGAPRSKTKARRPYSQSVFE